MKAQPFSFKTNEGFHNSIVKILLLYVGTSAIFLGIFLYLFYENRINSLRLQQMIQMRNEYVYLVDFITQNLISPTLEQDSSKTSVRELLSFHTKRSYTSSMKTISFLSIFAAFL